MGTRPNRTSRGRRRDEDDALEQLGDLIKDSVRDALDDYAEEDDRGRGRGRGRDDTRRAPKNKKRGALASIFFGDESEEDD